MKRRGFLASLLGAAALGSGISACAPVPVEKKDYSKIYFEKLLSVFRKIQDQELPKLNHVAIRAARGYRDDGQLLAYLNPAFFSLQLDSIYPDIPLLFLKPLNSTDFAAMASQIGENDFILTNDTSPAVTQIKRRGGYVVGMTVPMIQNQKNALNSGLIPAREMTTEEVSNSVIYSHVPISDGAVTYAPFPMMPLCPISTIAQLCLYWMVNTEIAYHIQVSKTYPFISKAREYLEVVMKRLHECRNQAPMIQQAASQMAQKIKSGGKLWVWDQGGILASEACDRGGGLMMMRPLDMALLSGDDVVIMTSTATSNFADLEMLERIKTLKALVVCITPFSNYSSNSCADKSDFALNNLSPESDGVVQLSENLEKTGLTGNIMNIALFWALTAQFIAALIDIGIVPYGFMAAHLPGGKAYNSVMQQFFEQRGY